MADDLGGEPVAGVAGRGSAVIRPGYRARIAPASRPATNLTMLLHLWTTNGFLFDAPRVFAAWGFAFRGSFVWIKPALGLGNYWRNSHELLLTAVRGEATRFNDATLRSWLECARAEHSAKPEAVRGMLERASPGPYLELFGRRPAAGWTVWGEQVERGRLVPAAAGVDDVVG